MNVRQTQPGIQNWIQRVSQCGLQRLPLHEYPGKKQDIDTIIVVLYFTPSCLSNFLQQSDLCVYLSVQTLGGREGTPYKMDGGACCTFQGLSEKRFWNLLQGFLSKFPTRLNTVRGNRSAFLTPEQYDDRHLRPFYMAVPSLGTDHSLTFFFCMKEYRSVLRLILFAIPTRGDRGRDKEVNSVQEVIKWCLVLLQKNQRSNYNTIQ